MTTQTLSGLTQAQGAVLLFDAGLNTTHQISIGTVGATTAGSLAVVARAAVEEGEANNNPYTSIYDSTGTVIAINMASPQPLIFSGNIDSIRITPTSFDGTTYSVTHNSTGAA
jgi:hypothetical protein